MVQQTEQFLAQPSRSAPVVKSLPLETLSYSCMASADPHNLILEGDCRQFSSHVPVSCTLTSGRSEPDSLDLTLGHSFVVRRTIWKIQIWRHGRFGLWVEIFGSRGLSSLCLLLEMK